MQIEGQIRPRRMKGQTESSRSRGWGNAGKNGWSGVWETGKMVLGSNVVK